jgi:hypothetical protein
MDCAGCKADEIPRAQECLSTELPIMTAIIRLYFPKPEARLNPNADPRPDDLAAAKEKTEFLKQLAGAGF